MPNLSPFTDNEIVELVRRKDQNLFAEIIRRYEKKLLRYAVYLTNDEHLAADAVQEGFIKAFINLHSYNTKLQFSSGLYRIVHNQAINLLKKNQRHSIFTDSMNFESSINLEDDLIKKELVSNLHDCLNQMDNVYKVPLVLFFLEEKSYQEISDILRIPIGTVGTRLNRAKQLVRSLCQKKQ